MAGSYRHCIDSEGKFLGRRWHLDNLGDAYEAIEEMYYMLQYLSGGSKEKLFEAYREGYCKTHIPSENMKHITIKNFYPEPDEE